jgi:hypothetical protein
LSVNDWTRQRTSARQCKITQRNERRNRNGSEFWKNGFEKRARDNQRIADRDRDAPGSPAVRCPVCGATTRHQGSRSSRHFSAPRARAWLSVCWCTRTPGRAVVTVVLFFRCHEHVFASVQITCVWRVGLCTYGSILTPDSDSPREVLGGG